MRDQLPNIYQWQHTWEGALRVCILQYVSRYDCAVKKKKEKKKTYYGNLCNLMCRFPSSILFIMQGGCAAEDLSLCTLARSTFVSASYIFC